MRLWITHLCRETVVRLVSQIKLNVVDFESCLDQLVASIFIELLLWYVILHFDLDLTVLQLYIILGVVLDDQVVHVVLTIFFV